MWTIVNTNHMWLIQQYVAHAPYDTLRTEVTCVNIEWCPFALPARGGHEFSPLYRRHVPAKYVQARPLSTTTRAGIWTTTIIKINMYLLWLRIEPNSIIQPQGGELRSVDVYHKSARVYCSPFSCKSLHLHTVDIHTCANTHSHIFILSLPCVNKCLMIYFKDYCREQMLMTPVLVFTLSCIFLCTTRSLKRLSNKTIFGVQCMRQ